MLVLFALGILSGRYVSWPLWMPFLAASIAMVGLFRAATRARLPGVAAAVYLCGIAVMTLQQAPLSPADLRRVVGDTVMLATLRGTLTRTPSLRRSVQEDGSEVERTLAFVDVEAVRMSGGWTTATGRVVVSSRGPLDSSYYGGRTVEVYGVLRVPAGPVAEGLFDYRAYLRWMGIDYELAARDPRDWRLVSSGKPDPGRPWSDRFLAWAQATLARGLPAEDEPLRLLWAMTLGWKTGLTNETATPFMQTGTMHVFAISGLHITLIAGILVHALRVIRIPRSACGTIVIPLIWLYTAATGWQSSAIRSTLMTTIVVGSWALRRPPDLVNSVAAAACLILACQPTQLFQAGFQLSFGVVFSIALLLPPLQEAAYRRLAPDPLIPKARIPEWRRRLGRPAHHLVVALGTSLAAWIGSAPLIAHYFHMATPVSLLTNLVVVPLSSLALACNLASLVCGTWLPAATELFNQSAWFWMVCMIRISDEAARWPGAFFYVPSPGPIATAFYYVLVTGLLTGWLLPPARRRLLGMCILTALVGGTLAWWMGSRSPRLTVLALPGGGSALFLDRRGWSHDLLFDTGNEPGARRVTIPFLQAQGVNRLSRLVLTHGDIRHVGGTSPLVDTFHPRRIATSYVPARSPSYRSVLRTLQLDPRRWEKLEPGCAIAGWKVLHPPRGAASPAADNNALVFTAEIEGIRILLLSDLGRDGQQTLVRSGRDLRADIVVAGLPQTGEPLGPELLAAISPELVLVNDAAQPVTEHAARPLRTRLSAQDVATVYTSDAGSLTLRLRSGRWALSPVTGSRLNGGSFKRLRGKDPAHALSGRGAWHVRPAWASRCPPIREPGPPAPPASAAPSFRGSLAASPQHAGQPGPGPP